MSPFLWTSKQARLEDPSTVGLGQLALPLLLESVLRCTVGVVNVAFLSHISDGFVSAVSVANQYIMICQTLAMAVATGTMVCINQAIGMQNRAKVDRLASVAFFSNLILGMLFGAVFFFFPAALLSVMKLEAASIALAGRYMRISGGLMAIQCMEIVLSNLCRSIGHTKAPLCINLTINAINLLCCYAVVFEPLPLTIDPVMGVAAASVLGRLGGLLLAAWIVLRSGVHLSLRTLRPFPKEEILLSLSIGVPGGMNNLAYSLSQLATTSVISLAGEMMVTAKIYVTQLVQYVALVGMAFANASTLMIGYRVGAGKYDEARTIRRMVTRIALFSNACCSALFILLHRPLLGMFTQNEEILYVGSIVIAIDFAVEIGRALNNTLAGSLQATGDVKFQLAVNQASGWLIAVGGSYLLGIVLGWGLYGVWICFALDELTRGLILLHRWRSNSWVIDADRRRDMIAGVSRIRSRSSA